MAESIPSDSPLVLMPLCQKHWAQANQMPAAEYDAAMKRECPWCAVETSEKTKQRFNFYENELDRVDKVNMTYTERIEQLEFQLRQAQNLLQPVMAGVEKARVMLASKRARVAYLESILNEDESYIRCRDCGAYVHERDNDWATTEDGDELCDECAEKIQDAEGNIDGS